jgi:L-phenylalanine/L-methionine N-acetyltransferase
MEDAMTIDQAHTDGAHSDPNTRPAAAGLTIRARELEDCAAITELVSLPRVRWGTLRLPFTSRAQTQQWLEQTSENRTDIVAVLDGRLVGTAGIIASKGRRSHVGGIGLCVHDDFQRRGIGTALLAALLDAADNWLNLRRLELTVYVDNAGAIALYEKFGFTIEGTRRQDAFREGAFVDSYAMARLRDG